MAPLSHSSDKQGPSRYRRTDQSVIRALRLLGYLLVSGKPLRITEFTTMSDMPKSTVHRLITSLCEAGWLNQEDHTDRYDWGPMAGNVVHALLHKGGQDILAYPELKRLADKTEEEVNFGVPVNQTMVYVQKIHTDRALRIDIPVGSSVPMHCTALGKAYLSAYGWNDYRDLPLSLHTDHTIVDWAYLIRDLQETARLGYSIDREEFLEGVTCVGAAIFGPEGHPVGAIAVQAPSVRMPSERLRILGDWIKESAGRITQKFGGSRSGKDD